MEPYAIVGGSPAKFIKYRFDKEIIVKLLKLKWWDLEINEIMENRKLLNSEDFDEFFKKYGL